MKKYDRRNYRNGVREAVGELPGWMSDHSDLYGLRVPSRPGYKRKDFFHKRLKDGSAIYGKKGSGYHVHSGRGRGGRPYAVLSNKRSGRHTRIY